MNERAGIAGQPGEQDSSKQAIQLGTDAELVIPVMREELNVQIQKYITGIVRVKKIVAVREEFLDLSTIHSNVVVDRIAVNKLVSEPPPVREEGETMVFSVVEEVLVTQTQYLVKEEIRVSRQQSQSPRHERFLLRTEEVVIEREPVIHPSKV